MGSPSYVRLTLVTSTLKITGLHYSYGCATLSAAYVGYLQFQNHLLTPHLWVYNVKLSLLLLASITQNTGLHYTYGYVILCAANAGCLFLENHWVTL